MSTLIHLRGGFKLSCGDGPMPPAMLEARPRLAYPTVHHDPASPSLPLVDLLWPNHPRGKAFHDLSIAHLEGLAEAEGGDVTLAGRWATNGMKIVVKGEKR